MSFLEGYEPVEVRLARFWEHHPNGRVATELVEHDERHCIVRSYVWRDLDDAHPAATGYAHEFAAERGINATSMLEVCETSSLGRCLANLGFSPKGARPSREEMTKATRPHPAGPAVDIAALKARIGRLTPAMRAALKVTHGWPPADPAALDAAVTQAETAAAELAAAANSTDEEPF